MPYTLKKPTQVSSRRKKYITYTLIASLVLVTLFGALEKANLINLIQSSSNQTSTSNTSGINFNPPTKEDAQAVDENKEEIVKQQEEQGQQAPQTPLSPDSNKKTVKPVIGSITSTQVRSLVPGIIENGGICTATFSKDGQTLTKTSTAFADAQNTICNPISYEGTAAGAGWQVTVTYESTTSKGTSNASTIQ